MGSGRQNIHTPDTAPGIDVGFLGQTGSGQTNLAYWGGGVEEGRGKPLMVTILLKTLSSS